MPEDNTQDSTPDSTEEVAIPKPTISADSEVQPSSEVSADAIAKQFDARLDAAKEELRREFQSKDDKRWAGLENKYGELSDVGQALAAAKDGGDPDSIYAAYELKTMRDDIASLKSAPPSSSAGISENSEAFDKAVGLLTEAGLASDPEVQTMMSGKFQDNSEMLIAVSELVLRRQLKPTAPAAAATPPASTGTAITGKVDVDALEAEYETLRLKGNWEAKFDNERTIHQRMQEINLAIETAG